MIKQLKYFLHMLVLALLLCGETVMATAQIPDTFFFKGEQYDLIGIDGNGLFSPKQYGMEPVMMHTGCYRGFYASYKITDKGIYLHELTIRDRNEDYKPINGIKPQTEPKTEEERFWIFQGTAMYREVNLLVSFTGTLLLAKDFIQEMYIHAGFQRPTAYKTVLNLRFEEGNLVKIKDRSKEVEKMRQKIEIKEKEMETFIKK